MGGPGRKSWIIFNFVTVISFGVNYGLYKSLEVSSFTMLMNVPPPSSSKIEFRATLRHGSWRGDPSELFCILYSVIIVVV